MRPYGRHMLHGMENQRVKIPLNISLCVLQLFGAEDTHGCLSAFSSILLWVFLPPHFMDLKVNDLTQPFLCELFFNQHQVGYFYSGRGHASGKTHPQLYCNAMCFQHGLNKCSEAGSSFLQVVLSYERVNIHIFRHPQERKQLMKKKTQARLLVKKTKPFTSVFCLKH